MSQEVSIDWLSVGGPSRSLGKVESWMVRKFGQPEAPEKGKFYQHQQRYPAGARLEWEPIDKDGRAQFCFVHLPGKALASLNGDERAGLLGELLAMGMHHCTRIDLAHDWHGEGLPIIQAAEESCLRWELCGARRKSFESIRAGGGTRGHTVYVGKRGNKGSGRFGRFYDKGLEQGGKVPGVWQRYEVVFSQGCAQVVFGMLLQSMGKAPVVFSDEAGQKNNWIEQAEAFIFGAFDFREDTGSREHDRRPRAAWWVAVLDGLRRVQVPVQARKKTKPSQDRMIADFRRRSGRLMSASDLTGLPPEVIVKQWLGDTTDIPRKHDAAVFEFCGDCEPVAA